MRSLDKNLLIVSLFFIGLGLVQIYSSSYIFATEKYGNSLHFFNRQLVFSFLGIAVMFFCALSPFQYFRRFGYVLAIGAAIGVGLTYVPGLGVKVGGAQRWIQILPSLRVEPSEFLKVTLPFWVAALFFKTWHPKIKYAAIAASVITLFALFKQPDFGNLVICVTITLLLLFSFGLKWIYILSSMAVAIPGACILILIEPYRYARLMSFIDPWADPAKKGFQVIQSMVSYNAGGLAGQGLGLGQGKLFFLPEAHTDFTLSVLGEEMGFLGVALVLILFAYIFYKGLQISIKCPQPDVRCISLGLTFLFAISVFINAGMTMGLLPPKGLTLPFLSYGGSSLICQCFLVGILLNIDRSQKLKKISQKYTGLRV